jgi:hypothetical protein
MILKLGIHLIYIYLSLFTDYFHLFLIVMKSLALKRETTQMIVKSF